MTKVMMTCKCGKIREVTGVNWCNVCNTKMIASYVCCECDKIMLYDSKRKAYYCIKCWKKIRA